MKQKIPLQTLHLFPILDQKLSTLLRSLTTEEWQTQTVARLWNVKDVAAHLLDGNLRALSVSRDHFFGEPAENIHSYQELVAFLNGLNNSWTKVARRLSPEVLIGLLESSGREYIAHLESLDPFANAVFSVAWAGQDVSPNWFHIAREYTEKFLHQQQIRDALNKPGLMTKELYYPFVNILMFALPHTFKEIEAPVGAVVSVVITGDIGGRWNIMKGASDWVLQEFNGSPDAAVFIDPDTAWKLFSKSWSPAHVISGIKIEGNRQLAVKALEMVSVMA